MKYYLSLTLAFLCFSTSAVAQVAADGDAEIMQTPIPGSFASQKTPPPPPPKKAEDCHVYDVVVVKESEKSVAEYCREAFKGNVDSMVFMATFFSAMREEEHTAKWYRKAAEKGNPLAQHKYAYQLAYGRGVEANLPLALSWFEKSANQGFILAQFDLGLLYSDGKDIEQDYRVAATWMTKAAEAGMPRAQFMLGYFFYNGYGVARDLEKAHEWLLLAAHQNVAPAQFYLGAMYADGDGVLRDYVKAYVWYTLARRNGVSDAAKGKALVAQELTEDELFMAKAQADSFAKNPDVAPMTPIGVKAE